MTQSPLVHPQMLRNLRNVFNKRVTINDPNRTTDPYGQEIIIYTPAEDQTLHAIRAYVEPANGAETRRPTDVINLVTFMIALAGYYPTIKVAQAALIGDEIYNITKVAHDDTNTITFLTADIVNPDEPNDQG